MIKLFLDEAMTRRITEVNFERVEAGKKKTLNLFMYNDSDNNEYEELVLMSEDPTLKVLSFPISIGPHGLEPITLEWSPPLNFERALETRIMIIGIRVITPKDIIDRQV